MIEYVIITSIKVFIHAFIFLATRWWWLIEDNMTLRLNGPHILPTSVPRDAELIVRWMLTVILFSSLTLIKRYYYQISISLIMIGTIIILYKNKRKFNKLINKQ